jgi:hypothetical protein
MFIWIHDNYDWLISYLSCLYKTLQCTTQNFNLKKLTSDGITSTVYNRTHTRQNFKPSTNIVFRIENVSVCWRNAFFFVWLDSPIWAWASWFRRGFMITHILDTPQSVGLLWTRDQLVAETYTWQHTTLTRDRHPCHRWDSNPRSQ